MIPIRIKIVQVYTRSDGTQLSECLDLPDYQWTPGMNQGQWNAIAHSIVMASQNTGLKPSVAEYLVTVYNASVSDCENEPRAVICTSNLGDNLSNIIDSTAQFAEQLVNLNVTVGDHDDTEIKNLVTDSTFALQMALEKYINPMQSQLRMKSDGKV